MWLDEYIFVWQTGTRRDITESAEITLSKNTSVHYSEWIVMEIITR